MEVTRMCAVRVLRTFLNILEYCISNVRISDVVNGAPRTLQGDTTSGPNMTIETCIEFCNESNFFFAGVEFGVSTNTNFDLLLYVVSRIP